MKRERTEGMDSEGHHLLDLNSSLDLEAPWHLVLLNSLGFRINGHRGNRRSSVFSRLYLLKLHPTSCTCHLSFSERLHSNQEQKRCVLPNI